MNGINKVAHNLAIHQQKSGYEVEIWGITPSPKDRPPSQSYALRLFQAKARFWGFDSTLKLALQALDGTKTRVHIHGSFIPEFYWTTRILQKKKIPYTYCPHGSLSPGALQKNAWRKRIYFHLFESRIVRNAQAVQFLGQTQYDFIDSWIKLSNKVLIPNGQNLEEIYFTSQDKKQMDYPIFSYCGRLDRKHKGLDILLEGFTRYREAGGKGRLWLIGDGQDRKSLKIQAKILGVRKLVKFWGSWYGEEKLRLLHQTDAFIHTSRYEGMPTSVLEAAGIGLPCLLSTPTNLAVFFAQKNAGFHIKSNEPQEVAAAMLEAEKMKNLGKLKSMGEQAKKLVEQDFNWDKIASEVIEKAYGI